jgi:hypothetical protein
VTTLTPDGTGDPVGTVCAGPNPFSTDDAGRLWLVIGAPLLPGDLYTVVVMTSNGRRRSIRVTREMSTPYLGEGTYVNPWGVFTVPRSEFGPVRSEVSRSGMREILSDLESYVAGDRPGRDRGLVVRAPDPVTDDRCRWLVVNNDSRPFAAEQFLAARLLPDDAPGRVALPGRVLGEREQSGAYADPMRTTQLSKRDCKRVERLPSRRVIPVARGLVDGCRP